MAETTVSAANKTPAPTTADIFAAIARIREAEDVQIARVREAQLSRAREAHDWNAAVWAKTSATDGLKIARVILPSERRQLCQFEARISLGYARACEEIRSGCGGRETFRDY